MPTFTLRPIGTSSPQDRVFYLPSWLLAGCPITVCHTVKFTRFEKGEEAGPAKGHENMTSSGLNPGEHCPGWRRSRTTTPVQAQEQSDSWKPGANNTHTNRRRHQHCTDEEGLRWGRAQRYGQLGQFLGALCPSASLPLPSKESCGVLVLS